MSAGDRRRFCSRQGDSVTPQEAHFGAALIDDNRSAKVPLDRPFETHSLDTVHPGGESPKSALSTLPGLLRPAALGRCTDPRGAVCLAGPRMEHLG